jgi:hypothetical protein
VSAHEHWDEAECGGDDGCSEIEKAPRCGAYPDGHIWTSDGMGGIEENPGVWATGGTTICTKHRCRLCGCVRTTVSVGDQRNPYECDSVSYEEYACEPDQEEELEEVQS